MLQTDLPTVAQVAVERVNPHAEKDLVNEERNKTASISARAKGFDTPWQGAGTWSADSLNALQINDFPRLFADRPGSIDGRRRFSVR